MNWKIKRDNSEWDCPDAETLKSLAREGRINFDDYIFNPVLDKWMYARDTAEIENILKKLPNKSIEKAKNNSKFILKIFAIIAITISTLIFAVPYSINLIERFNDPVYASVEDELEKYFQEIELSTKNTYEFSYLGTHWSGQNYNWRIYPFMAKMGNAKDYGDKKFYGIFLVFTYQDNTDKTWKFYGDRYQGRRTIAHFIDIPDESHKFVSKIRPSDKLVEEQKEQLLSRIFSEPLTGVKVDEIVQLRPVEPEIDKQSKNTENDSQIGFEKFLKEIRNTGISQGLSNNDLEEYTKKQVTQKIADFLANKKIEAFKAEGRAKSLEGQALDDYVKSKIDELKSEYSNKNVTTNVKFDKDGRIVDVSEK